MMAQLKLSLDKLDVEQAIIEYLEKNGFKVVQGTLKWIDDERDSRCVEVQVEHVP